MSFRIEIADLSLAMLRPTLSSSSSSVSDDTDSEAAPFTTSPLDSCRGGHAAATPVKYRCRKVRDGKAHKASSKKTVTAAFK